MIANDANRKMQQRRKDGGRVFRGDVPFTRWLADWLIDDPVAVLISMKEPVIAVQSDITTQANTHIAERQKIADTPCVSQIPFSQKKHIISTLMIFQFSKVKDKEPPADILW